jgi:hypothetical protein
VNGQKTFSGRVFHSVASALAQGRCPYISPLKYVPGELGAL